MLDLEPIRQRLGVQTAGDFLALFEECARLQRIEQAALAYVGGEGTTQELWRDLVKALDESEG